MEASQVDEVEGDELVEPVEDDTSEVGISLEDRMQARRKAIEQATSEKFDVPHYGGILQVELRPVGYKRQRRFAEWHIKHTRDPADRDLYTAADVLIAATVGFHVVKGEKLEPVVDRENDWLSMARKANPLLGDNVTPRVGLIQLVGNDNMDEFFREWREWNRNRGEDAGQELDLDLGVTR